ncbi:hypothetical protein AK89_01250 [Enterococcus mundtii CRL35]|nr:hypothetical protein AK89_01250 [Enterococcus mundtii CRL35]
MKDKIIFWENQKEQLPNIRPKTFVNYSFY